MAVQIDLSETDFQIVSGVLFPLACVTRIKAIIQFSYL